MDVHVPSDVADPAWVTFQLCLASDSHATTLVNHGWYVRSMNRYRSEASTAVLPKLATRTCLDKCMVRHMKRPSAFQHMHCEPVAVTTATKMVPNARKSMADLLRSDRLGLLTARCGSYSGVAR